VEHLAEHIAPLAVRPDFGTIYLLILTSSLSRALAAVSRLSDSYNLNVPLISTYYDSDDLDNSDNNSNAVPNPSPLLAATNGRPILALAIIRRTIRVESFAPGQSADGKLDRWSKRSDPNDLTRTTETPSKQSDPP